MLDIKKELLECEYIKDLNYLDEYINYIKESINKDYDNNTIYENHHILPRCIFPDYIKNKENIVKIGAKEHLKCHWLLYKLLNHRKISYALNMMLNRIDWNFDDLTEQDMIDYEEFRRNISKIISKTNKGKKHNQKFKDEISNRVKNTVVVKDVNNNTFRVNVNDSRYLSGELIYYATGRKYTMETRKKISEHNIKGLKAFNNGIKVKYMLEPNDEYKYLGQTDKFKKEASIRNKKIFIYNPHTNEQKRIKIDDEIPEGFIRGRLKKGNFVGFSNINKFIRILDIRTKKSKLINKEEYNNNYHIKNINIKRDMIYFAIVDNYCFYTVPDLKYYMKKKHNIKIKCNSHKIFEFMKNNIYNIKVLHLNEDLGNVTIYRRSENEL